MSEKQFEIFLVESLKAWLAGKVVSGERFQFRSMDPENTKKLLKALNEVSDGQIKDNDQLLPYIEVDHVKVIVAGHAESGSVEEGCYSENYLAKLRDSVVEESYGLIMIHNSALDTITNSTYDLAQPGAIWSTESIKYQLSTLIDDKVGNQVTSKCLLDIQSKMIAADNASIFGYRSLYESMTDGDLRFDELGLFNDPVLTNDWQGNSSSSNARQIERRIEENKKLRSDIEFEIEHHSAELEDRLTQFGSNFIKKHFNEGSESWKELTFDEYNREIEKQKKQNLEFDRFESKGCSLESRSKKDSGAGLRDVHLLIRTPADQLNYEFDICFRGDTTQKQEFDILPKKLNESLVLTHQLKGKKTTLTITGECSEQPQFFTVSLKRQLSGENYKFHCLVLPETAFYIDELLSVFLVNRSKQALAIQAEQQTLVTNPDLSDTHVLKDSGELIDISEVGAIDFQQLYDESDEVQFTLKSGATHLQVIVEGESAKDSLTLPLLMDVSRARNLFKDEYFGTFKPTKDSVILDNQETKQLFLRQQLLRTEWSIIEEETIDWNAESNEGTSASELAEYDELSEVHQSYTAFLRNFKGGKRKTLPSLDSWGPKTLDLGKAFVLAYKEYLGSLELDKSLNEATKLLMRLGTACIRDSQENRVKQYLTPFHPLVLSYTLYLVESILKDGEELSFKSLPQVTLKRLNARGLAPHLYDKQQGYSYTQVVDENPLWLEIVPREDSSFDYINKLVKTKIEEFTSTFKQLFESVPTAPILINSVNNADNKELFKGVLAYYMEYLEDGRYIQVNLYDDEEQETEFDIFAEMGSYDDIKERYALEKGAAKRNTDTIVDVLRTRLSFSKYQHKNVTEQHYAHLTFFKNNQVVDVRDNNIDKHVSSIASDGLLNGESSRSDEGAYFTAFGLEGVDYEGKSHLEVARYFGLLWQPTHKSNDSYRNSSAISLAVSDSVKTQLERSYDSSVWTTIIDPKVTLEFFQASQNVILIHYSDQYTSSSGYDAITVTKQSQLYKNVLGAAGESLIREFNAFNGEWLLQMVNDRETEKLGKKGVIASYKVVSAMLSQSEICWVPLSVAEMIRVAGNIGLAMSDSDFARHNFGLKKGAISDDILFAGFKDGVLYLLPVEAKAGSRPDYSKARNQATELKRYMEEMLGQQKLAGKLYRGLFIRQVLLQVEKYKLYEVFEENYFDSFEGDRVSWLQGEYEIGQLAGYPASLVVAHLNTDSCFSEEYRVIDNILEIDIPMSMMDSLVHKPYKELATQVASKGMLCIPDEYMLKPDMILAEYETEIEAESPVQNTSLESSSEESSHNSIEQSDIVVSEEAEQDCGPLQVIFGTDATTKQEVIWEPTDTSKLFNTNTGIIGTMGTGKTQFTKSLITQLVRNQHKNVGGKPFGILIFDYKADYVKGDFVEATGAKVYDLFHLPFNPFAIVGDSPMQPMHTANLFRATISKAFNLGPKQQNKARSLVTEAYEAAGIIARDKSTWNKSAPTLADVWSIFQSQEKVEQDSLYAALDDLVSFEIFESDSSKTKSLYDLIDGVTVINLSGYDEKIQNLVVALTLDLFYTQMHQRGSSILDGQYRQISKMILVDEADNFMSQDFDSLKKILKEGREFGVGTILSTQELTHFKTGDNDYSTLILSWVIHNVAKIKGQEIKAIFNTQHKNDEDRIMSEIQKLEKHYSLCVDGKKKVSKIKDLAFWELFE